MKKEILLSFALMFSFYLSYAQLISTWVIQPNLPPHSSGSRVLTDHSNNVYVSGIDSFFHHQTNFYQNFVLLKTDPDGNYLWKRHFAYPGSYMLMDNSDNIYLDIDGITKLDTAGNIVWQNNSTIPINPVYSNPVKGYLKLIDNNRNLYSLGYIKKNSTYDFDICLAKFDSLGNFLWNAVWDSFLGDDYSADMAVDNSGNVYVSGIEDYFSIMGNSNGVLLKYDAFGNKVWQYEYNGSQNKNDFFSNIAIDSNQNILIAAIENFDIDHSNDLLIKLDSAKNVIWKRNYSSSINGNEGSPEIKMDSENNIFLVGKSNSNIFINKYSNAGNLIWSNLFNFDISSHYALEYGDLSLDHYGNLIIVGRKDSIFTAIFDTNGNSFFVNHYSCGGGNGAQSVCIDQANNILVTGDLQGPKMIILKYGNMTSGINGTTFTTSILVYPNPSHDQFNINQDANEISQISIYNNQGGIILNLKKTNQFDLTNYSSGLYFYSLQFKDGRIVNGKIIKD